MRDALTSFVALSEIEPGDQVSVFTKLGRAVVDIVVTQVAGDTVFGFVRKPEANDQSTVNAAYPAMLYSFSFQPDDVEPNMANDDEFLNQLVLGIATNPDKPALEPESVNVSLVIPEATEAEPANDGAIDTSKLPANVKKQLRDVSELDEDSINRVVSAISDAAVRSMRSVGVRESDLYARVADIQKAIRPVLNAK